MPNSVDTEVRKSLIVEPSPEFLTFVTPDQADADSVCTSSYVERGPYLPLPIEGMNMGLRMIGNPPRHVAGFMKMPTCAGDHWYIQR